MAATSTHITVEEYLGTMYRPDCDYVDGELLERNLGEWDHSETQALLAAYFSARRRQWNLRVATEQRLRVRINKYRIPDICVVLGPKPTEPVLTSPPFLCIEILSPSDTRARMRERITDYLSFGVPFIWLIDPLSRRAWITTADGQEEEVLDGVLRAGECEVPLQELFD